MSAFHPVQTFSECLLSTLCRTFAIDPLRTLAASFRLRRRDRHFGEIEVVFGGMKLMSNRQSLLFMVVVATLSIRLVDDIGERPFYAILYLILGIWIIWTIADYRRGKRVFIWQK